MVEIGLDHITITDEKDKEIVHWIEDEWMEEPELAPIIANAVHAYYTKGPDFLKRLLGR